MDDGVKIHERLAIEQVLPYVNWTPFFHAWQLAGQYEGLDTLCACVACREQWLRRFRPDERPKAEQALRLYDDGCVLLREWVAGHEVHIAAQHAFYEAGNEDDVIVLRSGAGELAIPTLRQQYVRTDGTCLALSDFVSRHDRVGLFVVAVQGVGACAQADDDPYCALLADTLGNRLAEAASEYLHRTLLQGRGIRPAFGYPCLPDVSLLFDVERFFALHEAGIRLTENAAMQPLSAICGLYIAHPAARYFHIGTISTDQLHWYAALRGRTPDEMRKWLAVDCVSV